jgi:hypothetical protein
LILSRESEVGSHSITPSGGAATRDRVLSCSHLVYLYDHFVFSTFELSHELKPIHDPKTLLRIRWVCQNGDCLSSDLTYAESRPALRADREELADRGRQAAVGGLHFTSCYLTSHPATSLHILRQPHQRQGQVIRRPDGHAVRRGRPQEQPVAEGAREGRVDPEGELSNMVHNFRKKTAAR